MMEFSCRCPSLVCIIEGTHQILDIDSAGVTRPSKQGLSRKIEIISWDSELLFYFMVVKRMSETYYPFVSSLVRNSIASSLFSFLIYLKYILIGHSDLSYCGSQLKLASFMLRYVVTFQVFLIILIGNIFRLVCRVW